MKKKTILLLLSLVLAFALAACGTKEEPNNEPEVQEPETKEEDKKEEDKQEEDEQEPDSRSGLDGEEDIDDKMLDLTESDPITVNIYHSNANADGYDITPAEIYTLDIGQILDKLAEYYVLPETDSVRFNWMETKEVDGVMVIDLDMPQEFAAHLQNQGTAGEQMVIGSLVNTLLEAYGAEKILITVDGGVLESGHRDYPNYLSFYTE